MRDLKKLVFFMMAASIADQLIAGKKYQPYVRLVSGFLILSLMIAPVSRFLNFKLDELPVISTAVSPVEEDHFLDQAEQSYEKTTEKEIIKLMQYFHINIRKVIVNVKKEKRSFQIDQITVETTGGEKRKQKIKKILLRFYPVTGEHINISE